MLQVPPTGLQPSRPAAKVPHPEPAEAGFPAIALLAAAQLPTPATPGPLREASSPAGPDAREASVSQPSAEPGRSREAEPGRASATDPEHAREDEAVGETASPPSREPLPADTTPTRPIATVLEPGANPSQALPATLPLQVAAGVLPMPAAAAPPTGAVAAPIGTGGAQAPAEIPGPGVATLPAVQSEPAAAPESGPPKSAADVPAALVAAAAPEAPPAEAVARPVAAPPAAVLQTTAAAAPAKAGRGATVRNPDGTSIEAPPEPEQPASRPGQASGPEATPSQRTSLRTPQLPVQEADLPAAVAGRAALPETRLQMPLALPVVVRLSGPAGPARPAEVEPAAKDSAKPAESRRPVEEAQPHRTDAATPAADSAAVRPTTASTESATALPRSESLGMQPSQLQSATPSGNSAPVAPRAEAAATWQVPVPPVLQQVENGIRWMLRNASPGAELQLHPEALGRVRIELKVEGGEVHARLWASDPKSIPVLQEHKAFLEVSLKEQGLNLGSFDLRQNSNQAHPGLTDGQPRGQFWPTEAGAAEPRQDAPTRPAPRSANARRIELIA